jgi:transposase
LACRLKHSRWTWVCFTRDMCQETLFRGLIDCFGVLGCVPWVLVFDNMRTVTVGRDEHDQPIWHRGHGQYAHSPRTFGVARERRIVRPHRPWASRHAGRRVPA